MELALRIYQIRKAHRLTQAEVAYRCDITPSAYGQIERRAGNATFFTLAKIADAIGVSLSFLVDIQNVDYIEKKTSFDLLDAPAA
ncbi:helix-turn-helix transcriptional regulator [Flaviaesturariibacter amylovorans]|uniref:HTH cro/C1-type domain-containing protein n=1 Tax=Flaviaesturariibacter amylovorans TaxID=1084520 RepID=A0ABP8G636_9BACT